VDLSLPKQPTTRHFERAQRATGKRCHFFFAVFAKKTIITPAPSQIGHCRYLLWGHTIFEIQFIFKQGETGMGDKGKRDKGKREQQKKALLNPKEKRKLKKEKKNK